MTDLEMTRLCAEAMGHEVRAWSAEWQEPKRVMVHVDGKEVWLDPLHDDAQAMALVKTLHLHIDQRPGKAVSAQDHAFAFISERKDRDLNRAIVECVAKMQASLSTAASSKGAGE